MARRAVRVADLFQRDRFAAKLGEVLDFHNFVLQHYFAQPPVDFQRTLDEQLAVRRAAATAGDGRDRRRCARLRSQVPTSCSRARRARCSTSTSAPIRSSLPPTPPRASRATGTGLGPRVFDYVLGIVKAYTTRVGAGPFPTELFDEYGEHLSRVGHEFGSVTGRRRRCGWFDSVALRRSIVHSSVSGLCMTKLDVLDGLDTIRICVGYRCARRDRLRAAAVRR